MRRSYRKPSVLVIMEKSMFPTEAWSTLRTFGYWIVDSAISRNIPHPAKKGKRGLVECGSCWTASLVKISRGRREDGTVGMADVW